jgi:hypothetical protein
MAAPLHVIATVFNPAGFASRYRLFRDFEKRMRSADVEFHTIELALGDQPFVVTNADDARHIQVRGQDAIWYKENLVNVAIQKLPRDWEYVAWIDADIQFARPDWPEETIKQLQEHAFVQMFTHVLDMGPKYGPVTMQRGFSFRYPDIRAEKQNGKVFPVWPLQGQPGYAWAARRHEFEAVGGLLDWCVVGGGDYLWATGITGEITTDVTKGLSPAYAQSLYEWQSKCETHVKRNIGCVDDLIVHYWHGRRQDRGYRAREEILKLNNFDPKTDLVRDENGLLQLAGNKPELRDELAAHFESRDEDRLEP